jgi:hypothetical protein
MMRAGSLRFHDLLAFICIILIIMGWPNSMNSASAQINSPLNSPSNAPSKQLMPSRDDINRDTANAIARDEKTKQTSIEATIREGQIVFRNGQKYRAFHSEVGILLVPAAGRDVRPEDFEASLCTSAQQLESHPEMRMIAGVEKPLSKRLTSYASLMAKVFRQKCGDKNASSENPARISPEVGLFWDNGSKAGGKDKLFLNPMGVGFGASF